MYCVYVLTLNALPLVVIIKINKVILVIFLFYPHAKLLLIKHGKIAGHIHNNLQPLSLAFKQVCLAGTKGIKHDIASS